MKFGSLDALSFLCLKSLAKLALANVFLFAACSGSVPERLSAGGSGGNASVGGMGGLARGTGGVSTSGSGGTGGAVATGGGAGIGGMIVGGSGAGAGGTAAPVGKPIYLIGADPSSVYSSPNGTTWTKSLDLGGAPGGGENAFHTVGIGGGHAVALGNKGAYHSTDGLKWTRVDGNNYHGAKVVYGNGMFVALASDKVFVSPTGTSWETIVNTGEATHWHSIAYGTANNGNSYFFAAGDQWEFINGQPDKAPPRFKMSQNGRDWQFLPIHRGQAGEDDNVDHIVFGKGLFVAVGKGFSFVFDGTNWGNFKKIAILDDKNEPMEARSFGFDGQRFLRISWWITQTSSDGVNWTRGRVPDNIWPTDGMVFGDGRWIGLGAFQAGSVSASIDGDRWTVATKPDMGSLMSLAFGYL